VLLEQPSQSKPIEVLVKQVDEAEMDEMWSFVGNKKQQRWLWHAIKCQGDMALPSFW
jgi:hypothetical protein